MHILMLTSSLESGGAETHICSLASSLVKLGERVCVASSGGRLSEGLAWRGVRHIKLPLDSRSPFSIIKAARRLRKLVKKEKYDIIHIHSRLAGFICKLARVGDKVCVVSTVHSRFKSNFFLKRLSFWGGRSVAVSEDLRDYLSEIYRICPDNITLIANGIDTDKFCPSEKKNGTGAPRIIFVSRMDTDCSLCASLLCKIAPRLAKNFDGVVVELVGGGNAYAKICRQARQANDRIGYECVIASGFVKNVKDKLCSSDVFVGVSRAALEAMSCAVPTVLAGNEGFIGLLDSSKMSLAAQSNFCCRGSELPTSDELFSDISTLLEMSAEQRRTLGAYLRSYVCDAHSIDKLAERTLSFYREALRNVPRKRADAVLCGYYGFSNLGDDASLRAAIEKCRGEKREPCVICKGKKRTSRVFGARCVSRYDPFAVLGEFGKCDKLILGGGSILQNATSNRSLWFYSSLIFLAKKRGCEVELWANGLGPFKSRSARRRAARVLGVCDKIGLRDTEAVALARSLGAKDERIALEDDLAKSIRAAEDSRVDYILKKLGVSDKRFSLIGVNGRSQKKLVRQIERKTLELCRKDNILPIFVVMQSGRDGRISKRLAKRCRGGVLTSVTPSELRGLVRRAEFALGTRYHLLYFAALEKVDVYPFGDDPKMSGLGV